MDIKKEMTHHLDAIGLIVNKKTVTEDQVAREIRNVMRTTGFKLLEEARAPTDEIHSMICLSTEHVTKETASSLELQTDDVPVTFQKREYGYFIVVPDKPFGATGSGTQDPPTCPADMISILAYARARGCTWIMLDSDGPVVDGLKTWEW